MVRFFYAIIELKTGNNIFIRTGFIRGFFFQKDFFKKRGMQSGNAFAFVPINIKGNPITTPQYVNQETKNRIPTIVHVFLIIWYIVFRKFMNNPK